MKRQFSGLPKAQRRVVWVLVLLVLLALSGWLWPRKPEVEYGGRPVIVWLADVSPSPYLLHVDPALETLQELPANELIPLLEQALGTKESGLERSIFKLKKWYQNQIQQKYSSDDRSNSERLRLNSAHVLATLGTNAWGAVPALIRALNDPSADVRAAAAEALGDLRPPDESAVNALVTALSDATQPVRVHAASAIGRFHSAASHTVPALLLALDVEADSSVRRSLVGALGEIRTHASLVLPKLASLLDDSDDWMIQWVCSAIKSFGGEATNCTPPLLRLLNHSDEDVQLSAATALAQVDPVHEPLVRTKLISLTSSTNEWLRLQALEALGNYPEERRGVEVKLEAEIQSSDVATRLAAAEMLLEISPDANNAILPTLIDVLAHEQGHYRAKAAVILRKMKPPQVILIRFQDETNRGRVTAWQDPAGLIHRL